MWRWYEYWIGDKEGNRRALGSKTFAVIKIKKMKVCSSVVSELEKKKQNFSIFSRKCWKIWVMIKYGRELIHIFVRQKSAQHFKVIILQLKNFYHKKNFFFFWRESKVTSSVEFWGRENDGSFQKLGSWEESRFTFFICLCAFFFLMFFILNR